MVQPSYRYRQNPLSFDLYPQQYTYWTSPSSDMLISGRGASTNRLMSWFRCVELGGHRKCESLGIPLYKFSLATHGWPRLSRATARSRGSDGSRRTIWTIFSSWTNRAWGSLERARSLSLSTTSPVCMIRGCPAPVGPPEFSSNLLQHTCLWLSSYFWASFINFCMESILQTHKEKCEHLAKPWHAAFPCQRWTSLWVLAYTHCKIRCYKRSPLCLIKVGAKRSRVWHPGKYRCSNNVLATYSCSTGSRRSRSTLVTRLALCVEDRCFCVITSYLSLYIYNALAEYVINKQQLTGGPGRPWRPVNPLCPFCPLSPESPASPLSPRGPCGPCD